VEVQVRLTTTRSTATAYSSNGDVVGLDVRAEDGQHSFRLPELGLYTVVVLSDGEESRAVAKGRAS
jgi:hypothetical protein